MHAQVPLYVGRFVHFGTDQVPTMNPAGLTVRVNALPTMLGLKNGCGATYIACTVFPHEHLT